MATRALRARIVNPSQEMMQSLRRTHEVFNVCLRQMVERYLSMRKGTYGQAVKELTEFMLSKSNTFAHGVMDKLTREEITTTLSEDWIALAQKVIKERGPLFLQHEGFATVNGRKIHTKGHGSAQKKRDRLAVIAKFWHQVCDDASAFIKSYDALMEQWRTERQEWVAERQKWIESQAEFMAFWEGPYRQFQEECERKREEAQKAAGQEATTKKHAKSTEGKRYARWHLWYEWLCAHPEVIEWRGRAKRSEFKQVPPDVQKTIKATLPRQDKHVPKFLDWLKENNPELGELERLRRQYLREFNRFKRPPTLTLPSPERHPRWFTMERGVFYKDIDFERGTVKLQLIAEDEDGAWSLEWLPVQIQSDPRLKPSHRAQAFKKEGRLPPYAPEGQKNLQRTLTSPAEKAEERLSGVFGARLILRKNAAQLVFNTVDQDCPPRGRFTKVKGRTCSADNLTDLEGNRIPLRALAVDLGIRHIGGYCVADGTREEEGWRLRWVANGILKGAEIPNLFNLRQHERQLRKQRRERGKPVRGQRSFVALQDHRTHMADDRFKKAADAIVGLARKHEVHLILFEQLQTLVPRAWDERWVNAQLRLMNRRHIVETVAQIAKEFGILVDERVSPWKTSHVCSRCHLPGMRFSIKAKSPFHEKRARRQCEDYGYPIWDAGGHLFRCPHCEYKIQADINAAGNLLAKFFGLWKDGLKCKDWVYAWKENGSKREMDARKMFDEWAAGVRQRKYGADAPF